MTYLERMALQTLSFRAYGKTNHYKKIQRDGLIRDMEQLMDDGTIRKYRGYLHPDDTEIVTVMEQVIKEKEEAALEAAKHREAEEQPFKDVPAPTLNPFIAEVTAQEADSDVNELQEG